MTWIYQPYKIASPAGIKTVDGLTYKGIGIHMKFPSGVVKPPFWEITHLNSGHRICYIAAPLERTRQIATEIADMADWDFQGLEGWRNLDPEIRDKMNAIEEKYHPDIVRKGGKHPLDPDQAREIMLKRLDEDIDNKLSTA